MSTEAEMGAEAQHDTTIPGEYDPPSELESAFLTIAMFGGLVAFALGCFLMGGFG